MKVSTNGRTILFAASGTTTSKTGLAVKSELDSNTHPAGIRISDQQMTELRLSRALSMETRITGFCPEVDTFTF
jgi:hypothetical protein